MTNFIKRELSQKNKNSIDYLISKINRTSLRDYVSVDYASEYIESEDRTRIFDHKIVSIEIYDYISYLTVSNKNSPPFREGMNCL